MNQQARKDGRSAYGDPASPEAEDFEMVGAQSTLFRLVLPKTLKW